MASAASGLPAAAAMNCAAVAAVTRASSRDVITPIVHSTPARCHAASSSPAPARVRSCSSPSHVEPPTSSTLSTACVASPSASPSSRAQRRPTRSSASSSGMTRAGPLATRSSTASASGRSSCG
eukprot:4748489-Pleurochrysis_carterae.AAC.1